MRLTLLVLLACPAAFAAPLKPGDPALSLRLEGLFGQPTTLYGVRGGAGVGLTYRMTDQLSFTADAGQRALPGGGMTTGAIGLQATLDITPVSPFFELSFVAIPQRAWAGFSLATRTSFGADWQFSRTLALGLVVRQLVAFDPVDDVGTPGGTEAAIRFVFTPGGK